MAAKKAVNLKKARTNETLIGEPNGRIPENIQLIEKLIDQAIQPKTVLYSKKVRQLRRDMDALKSENAELR
jgi:hypothetical protein